jgi:ethanolaminephosphotransferase
MFQTRLFVSDGDIEALRKWKYSVVDHSITTKLVNPFWNWLVSFVPKECAPNVLTLAGFVCIILCFSIGYTYRHTHPHLTALSSAFMGFSYWHLDSIDGK